MRLKILIVDDSEATRGMLRDFFEINGHNVVADADAPDSALKAFAEHKPDLVTLDLSLKDGNGLGVLKSMRRMDPNAKILVISGNSQKAVRESVLASGAGFLGKPIDFDALLAAVTAAAP